MEALRALPTRLAGALLAAALALGLPAAAAAEDPTPAPTSPPTGPARPTCAERFPAEGPAGVDLRLGCIVGEVVGLYTPGSDGAPAPISTWAVVLATGVAGALLLAWLVTRALARRAGARLAPVMPGTWWVCDRCRSVNGADARRCYACGAPAGAGPSLPTAERPETPQSFGDPGSR